MEELDKKLSLMLDGRAGEAGADELAAAIDEVGGDVNLQYRLRRYRLIGEGLRNELPAAIDPGFHASVMARIADMETSAPARHAESPTAAASTSLFGWLTRPVAGLAVAATVAMVTVVLWQPQDSGGVDNGEIAAIDQQQNTLPSPVVSPVATPVSTTGMRWKVDDPALQRKLNAYLVNHTEYATPMQGIIPQARVAGFDSER